MKGCHRCGHAADVEAGKYRGVPWTETPCAVCGQEPSSAGTMCYDEEVEERGAQALEPAEAGEGSTPEGALSEMMPVNVLSRVVHGLLSLPPIVRDTVCWRFQGLKYREIAERQGVSVAAVELRHRRAMKRWPELRALFVVKAKKQKRRKPGRRGNVDL